MRYHPLPYESVDEAATAEEAKELLQQVEAFEIPGFAVCKSLGYEAINSALDEAGWEYRKSVVKKGGRDPIYRMSRGLGFIEHDQLHFDSFDDILFEEDQSPLPDSLIVHNSDKPCRAILTTPWPTKHYPRLIIGEVMYQDKRLWQGKVDSTAWKDIRFYEGNPDKYLLFRSTGKYPVAHSFQTIGFNVRNTQANIYGRKQSK